MNLRRRLGKMLRGRRTQPAILMYHRIAEPAVDPWGLSVSPANFRSQLATLKRTRTPLSMNAFAERLATGSLPANAIALTFDDGYLDNLQQAKPLLDELGVPATVFVTTGWIGSDKLFWWDELTRLILLSREPFGASVTIDGEIFAFDIGTADDWEPRQTWRSWDPPRSERETLYHTLWTKLQRLDEAERERIVSDLGAQLGRAPVTSADRTVTREELARLPSAMVGVGVHAVTHQPLTSMTPEKRKREVTDSRALCEEIVGTPMTGFAYPHGDFNAETRDIVEAAGFDWAVTTESRAVPRDCHPLALPRIMVPDVSGEALLRHIARECA